MKAQPTASIITLAWMIVLAFAPAAAWAQDAAAGQPAAPASPAPPSSDDIVRAVLLGRCGSCHGSTLSDPDGEFGFVDKLETLARDAAFIRAGDPDHSYLFELIRDGEMPPRKAPQMTEAEKTIVRDWIAGLASAQPASADSEPAAGDTGSEPPAAVKIGGRFHVLMVHFPIALMLAALLAELLVIVGRRSDERMTVARFCTWTGALGAIAATATGWMGYLTDSFMRPELLEWHKIGGTVVAVLAITAVVLVEWAVRSGSARARWALRGMLILLAICIMLTAHQGGQVVHGANHLPF